MAEPGSPEVNGKGKKGLVLQTSLLVAFPPLVACIGILVLVFLLQKSTNLRKWA